MPRAESALIALLTVGSPNPVAAIVGTRVYPRKLPQSVIYPAIRYQRISTNRSQFRDLTGFAHYAMPRFQIDCYTLSEAEAIALGQAVFLRLEGFAGMSNGLRFDSIANEDEAGDLEEGAGPGGADLYRQRFDFFLPHPE
jgi:hypothetical protein